MFRLIQTLSLLLLVCRSIADDDDNTPQIENCDDAVVQVSNGEVLCDSNSTYYYGSSVHRSSTYCDEVDKATIAVDFDVGVDLEEGSDIYMTFAISNEAGDVLYEEPPTSLCDYVGDECIYQGSYSFATTVQLEPSSRNQTDFLPYLQMAFSSKTNGKSSLGGVNLDKCGNVKLSSQIGSNVGGVGGIIGITIGVLALIVAAIWLFIQYESKSKSKPKKSEHAKGGTRMNQDDYGIILGETSVNSSPLISEEGGNQAGEDEQNSAASTEENSQSSDPENPSEYQPFDFEDHPLKAEKRSQSVLRFLLGKQKKREQSK